MRNDNLKTYIVHLQSDVSLSYRCKRAADSLDIDTEKKSVHHLKVKADVETDFNIGLIIGSSGSGKTTLAKRIWGEDCFKTHLDLSTPIIEQFPKELSYDECAEILSGVGLTSVPCWIRPAYTLSNGQRARAEAALAMFSDQELVLIDEWTSVVDRTVGKVMSHCIQKFARKKNKKIVLVSCHYDVEDWLLPDWMIDCNKQTYDDFRRSERRRSERLTFEIRPVTSQTWKYFSKYHYLSDRLPGGKIFLFGLFKGKEQIGFQCFANYIPIRRGSKPIFHSNRVVIHPDYCGLGLGIQLVNACAKILKEKYKYEIRATFSSVPLLKSRLKDKKNWKLLKSEKVIGQARSQSMDAKYGYNGKYNNSFNRLGSAGSFRSNVTTYTFQFVGQ